MFWKLTLVYIGYVVFFAKNQDNLLETISSDTTILPISSPHPKISVFSHETAGGAAGQACSPHEAQGSAPLESTNSVKCVAMISWFDVVDGVNVFFLWSLGERKVHIVFYLFRGLKL